MIDKRNSCKLFLGGAILLPLALTGCGGSSDSDVNSSSQIESGSTVAISARDITTAVYENTSNEINLSSSVYVSDNSTPTLASVTPISDNAQCDDVTANPADMSFTVNSQDIGVCVYEYTVSAQNGAVKGSGTTQVTITSPDYPLISTNTLTTIPANADVGGAAVDIQLTTPTYGTGSYTLSENVTIIGSGEVAVDVTQEKLTYIPGSEEGDAGLTKIIYSYYDEDGLVLVGAVNVSVSVASANQVPTAESWTYVENEDLGNSRAYTTIDEGEIVEVDLSNVYTSFGVESSLVNDLDNPNSNYDPDDNSNVDTLQLIYLQVANADVCFGPKVSATEEECIDNIANDTDLNNLTFRFKVDSVGSYEVTYVVSDQKGGYAVGSVTFKVDGMWPDVVVYDNPNDDIYMFTAPLSLRSATAGDYKMSGIAAEEDEPNGNGVKDVPTYSWEEAYAICLARGGTLPTTEQWDAFYAQEGNAFNGTNDLGWPVERYYFTNEVNTLTPNMVYVYDPKTGDIHEVESGQDDGPVTYLGYLACIDQTPVKITIENNYVVLDRVDQLYVSYSTAAGKDYIYDAPLYWSYSEAEEHASEAMPNIDTNVELGTYTGLVKTTAGGYVKYTAVTPLNDLMTSKEIITVDNLLSGGGADPTFDTDPNASSFGACEEELLTQDGGEQIDSSPTVIYGYAKDMPDGYVAFVGRDVDETNNIYSAKVHNCNYFFEEGTNAFYRLQSPGSTAGFAGRSRIGFSYLLDNDTVVSLDKNTYEVPYTGNYTYNIWLYWPEETKASNNTRMGFNVTDDEGSVNDSTNGNRIYYFYPNTAPAFQSANGWAFYEQDVYLEKGKYGMYLNHLKDGVSTGSRAVYVDDVVLTPTGSYDIN